MVGHWFKIYWGGGGGGKIGGGGGIQGGKKKTPKGEKKEPKGGSRLSEFLSVQGSNRCCSTVLGGRYEKVVRMRQSYSGTGPGSF